MNAEELEKIYRKDKTKANWDTWQLQAKIELAEKIERKECLIPEHKDEHASVMETMMCVRITVLEQRTAFSF